MGITVAFALLPAVTSEGRPRSVDHRAVINAIFYSVVAGCAWRMLPHDDFPKWKTVYHYFRAWRLDGTWQPIHAHFVQWERVAQGHQAAPSADSLRATASDGLQPLT
jgi:putative transposase